MVTLDNVLAAEPGFNHGGRSTPESAFQDFDERSEEAPRPPQWQTRGTWKPDASSTREDMQRLERLVG